MQKFVGFEASLDCTGDLTLVLDDANHFYTSSSTETVNIAGSLTIKGVGSLSIVQTYSDHPGMVIHELVVESGTVSVLTSSNPDGIRTESSSSVSEIKGGSVAITSQGGRGIWHNSTADLIVSGGMLEALTNRATSYAIRAYYSRNTFAFGGAYNTAAKRVVTAGDSATSNSVLTNPTADDLNSTYRYVKIEPSTGTLGALGFTYALGGVPLVGYATTATLTVPANTKTTLQWYRHSFPATGGGTAIGEAASVTPTSDTTYSLAYTPSATDEGKYLYCLARTAEGRVVGAYQTEAVGKITPALADPAQNAVALAGGKTSYTRGETVTFTATGSGPVNATPGLGDTRWLPTGYTVDGATTAITNGNGVAQSFGTTGMTAGTNKPLTVTFTQQQYTGTAWADTTPAVTDTKSVSFTLVQGYTVAASASPAEGGQITGVPTGPKASNSQIALSASPNSGYRFWQWTENSTQVSTNADYSFQLTANRTLVAEFALDPPAGENAITGVQPSYVQGETVTFTAVGSGMNKAAYRAGDWCYFPTSWATNPTGDFGTGYTQSFDTTGMSTGAHTLSVTFTRRQYTGTAWADTTPAVTDTKSVGFTLTALPPVVTEPTAPQTPAAAIGSPVTLTVTTANVTAYQWFYRPSGSTSYAPIPGATGSSYTTPALTAANDGDQYYCLVTGPGGSIESPLFTLRVRQPDYPQTGDPAAPLLWLALALLAGAGGLLARRRWAR